MLLKAVGAASVSVLLAGCMGGGVNPIVSEHHGANDISNWSHAKRLSATSYRHSSIEDTEVGGQAELQKTIGDSTGLNLLAGAANGASLLDLTGIGLLSLGSGYTPKSRISGPQWLIPVSQAETKKEAAEVYHLMLQDMHERFLNDKGWDRPSEPIVAGARSIRSPRYHLFQTDELEGCQGGCYFTSSVTNAGFARINADILGLPDLSGEYWVQVGNWIGLGIRMVGEDGLDSWDDEWIPQSLEFHAEYSMYLPEGATLYLSGLKGATAPREDNLHQVPMVIDRGVAHLFIKGATKEQGIDLR